MGQPEVKLGLIPGAGGTQRLPRLAGVEPALEMCVYGEPLRMEDAKRLGIIDRIAEADLLASAIQFAKEVRGLRIRRTREVADKLGTRESNAALFAAWREKVVRCGRRTSTWFILTATASRLIAAGPCITPMKLVRRLCTDEYSNSAQFRGQIGNRARYSRF